GKGRVSILPIEELATVRQVVDPFRGFALDLLEHHRDGDIGLEFGKDVDVIGYSTDFQQDAALTADDAADVFVESLPEVVADQRGAVFGRIHDVVEKVGEGGGHGLDPSRGRYFVFSGRGYRRWALAPRARFEEAACAPSGLRDD